MLKVLRNLQKSWVSVIFIIILLCVQATTDLALPDYTSKIVNNGIQAGGIEVAVPEIISEADMNNLLFFTDKDDEILENYELVEGEFSSHQEKVIKEFYGKDYEIKEELYVLKDLTEEKLDNLENIMSDPLLEYSTVSNEETSKKLKEEIMNITPEAQKNLINSMSIMDIIKQMPEAQRDEMLKQFTDYISKMADTVKEQAAVTSVKQIYINIGIDTNKLQNDYILLSGLQMLGIALISMISAVSIMLLSSRVAAKLGETLRDKVFKKVLSYSTAELREFSTASLITRSTNDIQQIQQLLAMLFRVVVYAPIIGIGGFIKVLTSSDSSMAWIIGVAIAAILVIVATLFGVAMPKFKKLQDLIDKLNQVSREILTGLPVIRAFNKEKKEEDRFADSNRVLMKTNIFVNRAMSMMMPLLMFIMSSITVLIVWVGAHNVDSGTMQVGDMMAFIQYTMQIVMAFLMISMISIMLPRAAVSARRINEVIETDSSIKDKEETKKFDPNKKGLVEFKNVSFRYADADENTLNNISFTCKKGETTAIIGSTGSGKSTIAGLIMRFHDITNGKILLKGQDIRKIPQKEVRKHISYVPQVAWLFSGTIEDNLNFGNSKATRLELNKSLKIAQADFVNDLEGGVKARVAQGGKNFSGGQKQRLAIARALIKKADLYVFDDSFSALDFKTDSKLRNAINENIKNASILVIAQRISTILNANQIIVLNDGEIVGIGTHDELMKNCTIYQEIANSQLKGGK